MVKRNTLPSATVIQLPRRSRLDVRDALLNNQSDPKVATPAELQEAINTRARELAEEAYKLCQLHLRRRVAWQAECGYPERAILMDQAYALIKQGDLGDALTRVYRQKMDEIVRQAQTAARISQKFKALADEVCEAAGTHGDD